MKQTQTITKYNLPEFIAEHDKLVSEGWTFVTGYKSAGFLQGSYELEEKPVEKEPAKPAPKKRTTKKPAEKPVEE